MKAPVEYHRLRLAVVLSSKQMGRNKDALPSEGELLQRSVSHKQKTVSLSDVRPQPSG